MARKTAHRKTTPKAPATRVEAARAAAERTGEVIRENWNTTREALVAAQGRLEKQVKALMKSGRLSSKEAATLLENARHRVEKERERATRELDSRVKAVQARVKKERKAVGRAVDDAVKNTLAALNIPSRQEVADLTRKVDELSRKIDAFRATARRRSTRPAKVVAAPAHA